MYRAEVDRMPDKKLAPLTTISAAISLTTLKNEIGREIKSKVAIANACFSLTGLNNW
jgi:hypothetical protein